MTKIKRHDEDKEFKCVAAGYGFEDYDEGITEDILHEAAMALRDKFGELENIGFHVEVINIPGVKRQYGTQVAERFGVN